MIIIPSVVSWFAVERTVHGVVWISCVCLTFWLISSKWLAFLWITLNFVSICLAKPNFQFTII